VVAAVPTRAAVSAAGFDPSFAAVLALAQDGDRGAFEQMYRLLHRRVLAFARVRRCPDPEGLVNDVFLQVFRSLSTFDGTENQFKAWLFRIARNRMIDEARRVSRRPVEVADEAYFAVTVVAADDVEGTAIANVNTDSLLLHLDALTSDQRDVLILRIVSDLTVEAVAGVLGKRVGAVKALQRRAFRSLARTIGAGRSHPAGPRSLSMRGVQDGE
jgi:RNA polymerase sigma-70 factor (ECF subfamily)